jgi:hypothetical protein
MKLKGFVNETYPARSVAIETDRAVNWFLEQDPQDEKNYIALIGTPGTAVYKTAGNGPVRPGGLHVFNNQLFVVSGNQLFDISAAGVVSSALGTLQTSSGPVSMADNGLSLAGVGGNQLMITDGAAGYIYQLLTQMTFTNGAVNPTGLTIQNIAGTATAFVVSVTVTSGSWGAGTAAGTLTVNAWNGVNFATGAGTNVFKSGGQSVQINSSWTNGSPGYNVFTAPNFNITDAEAYLPMTFINGNLDPTGLEIQNQAGTATAFVDSVTLTSGSFAAGTAAGTMYLYSWNNIAFSIGAGTNVYINYGGSPGAYSQTKSLSGWSSSWPYGTTYLSQSGFGFYIPTGATITGISVQYSGTACSTTDEAIECYLMKAGVGVNVGKNASLIDTLWQNNAVPLLGSSADLWGNTWAPSDVNNSGFGIRTQGSNYTGVTQTWSCTTITITVYYNILGQYAFAEATEQPQAISLTCAAASIPMTSGYSYQIVANLTSTNGQLPTLTGTNGVPSTPLVAGTNTINFTATGTSTVLTLTSTSSAVFNVDLTMTYLYLTAVAEATSQPTSTSAFSTISGGGWPGTASQVTFMDGYFIINVPGSMSFYVSNLYDGTTWNALATSPVAASPSILLAVTTLHQQLWLIKDRDSEVWYDTGTATSTGCPFSRISGAVIGYGIAAPFSLAKGDNSLLWLANENNNEQGLCVGIVEMTAYVPTIISPPSINYQINQFSVISDAIGYFRAIEGHKFYVLTFPTANWTIVYDASNGQWHEWSTYVGPTYVEGTSNIPPPRHIGNCFCVFQGMHLVGDWNSGNIYQLSSNILTDNGTPIVSIRISAHEQDKDDLDNIFISKFQLDAQVGQGEVGGATPNAYLAWSDDGGNTYGNSYPVSMGTAGQYKTRMIWRKLGHSRDRVWMLIISDPIQKVILGAYVD